LSIGNHQSMLYYRCDVCSGLSNDKRQLTWNQSASADCARTKVLGLVRDQRLICQRNPDLMPAVMQAAKDSVDVCQELFADRRWNCSTVTLGPNYLPDLASSMYILVEEFYNNNNNYYYYINNNSALCSNLDIIIMKYVKAFDWQHESLTNRDADRCMSTSGIVVRTNDQRIIQWDCNFDTITHCLVFRAALF